MNYDTINDIFLLRFPELDSLFKEKYEAWGEEDIPQHCFLGDVLNYYLTVLLRENTDKHQIKKIFSFYEEMAACDDVHVRDLLQVTLLEYLWDEKTVFTNALNYMQPKTHVINDAIRSYIREPVDEGEPIL